MKNPRDIDMAESFDFVIKQSHKEYCADEIERIFLNVYDLILNNYPGERMLGLKRRAALVALVNYTVGEYEFYREDRPKSVAAISDAELYFKISNKYVSQRISEDSGDYSKGMKPQNHLVSTLATAAMVIESLNEPLARHDPNFSLLNDIFETTFKKIIGFTKMLVLGLYLDAYVAWRTIHETEATIYLLVNNEEKTRQSYLRHILYSDLYYNPQAYDDEYRDGIFENEIKATMAQHGLKSKDMKKFLEYGWLYDCSQFDMEKHPKFKLNFNDGVDELAGFRDDYNEFYRGTSEISHSSSIFFYANEVEIKSLALMLTYESSYRIFELYMKFMNNYFEKHPNEKVVIRNVMDDVKKIAVYLRMKYEEEGN
jgi:hypothetical protein